VAIGRLEHPRKRGEEHLLEHAIRRAHPEVHRIAIEPVQARLRRQP
jgi:hypothetical protein